VEHIHAPTSRPGLFVLELTVRLGREDMRERGRTIDLEDREFASYDEAQDQILDHALESSPKN
jgi:hypothetical protein